MLDRAQIRVHTQCLTGLHSFITDRLYLSIISRPLCTVTQAGPLSFQAHATVTAAMCSDTAVPMAAQLDRFALIAQTNILNIDAACIEVGVLAH